nr:P-loop NTPase [Wohlfahrtiimonas chitiniclastica]
MKEKIINALNDVKVIYDNKRLGELLRIKSVEWQESDQSYTVTIALNFESKTYNDALVKACSEAIEPLLQRGQSARFVINAKNVAHKVQNGLKPMDNIKNIIAVGSGKGGVGKSTTSINLAHALKNEGFTVGILDADIYGPSMPKMLGTNERPRSRDNKSMEPIDVDGLQAMSIGFLVDEENAMIWRAPWLWAH